MLAYRCLQVKWWAAAIKTLLSKRGRGKQGKRAREKEGGHQGSLMPFLTEWGGTILGRYVSW